MSDTITLCTRILLAAQDLHNERADHGGSGGTRSTRKDRWKENMAEVLDALTGIRRAFNSRPGKMNPNACEAIMLS